MRLLLSYAYVSLVRASRSFCFGRRVQIPNKKSSLIHGQWSCLWPCESPRSCPCPHSTISKHEATNVYVAQHVAACVLIGKRWNGSVATPLFHIDRRAAVRPSGKPWSKKHSGQTIDVVEHGISVLVALLLGMPFTASGHQSFPMTSESARRRRGETYRNVTPVDGTITHRCV